MAWKIALWIGRILATIMIACLLSIWTTSYVVTSYIQALLKQYEIPLEIEPVALGDVWGMLKGSKPSQQVGATLEEDHTEHGGKISGLPSQPSTESVSGVDKDGIDRSGLEGTKPADDGQALAIDDEVDPAQDAGDDVILDDVFTQPAEEVLAPIEKGENPTITPEDIEASKDSLSTEDKERMFELMMDKLPPESWHMFSSYVEDGLTEKELLDVQQLMAQHLSKEEYSELMELLTAY